jgi:hypothetical protein
MNEDRVKTKIVKTKKQFFDILLNDRYTVHDTTTFKNGEILLVNFSEDMNIYHTSKKTNVIIGAFVTCYGRLKLYEELVKLQNRVLYFDTDSIIFTHIPGQYLPKIGDFLGEFTNELEKDTYITEFSSCGPKSYSYLLNNNKTKCTVKGFTLSHLTSLKINFESIKDIVCNDQKKKIPVTQQIFKADMSKFEINVCEIEKLYSFVYDKRILNDDLTTNPYGYINN